MHMNSVPQHLHTEDRQEYERILDEALRSAPAHPELTAVGQRLNTEQLRTMALDATALITAAAATEYRHYTEVRDELRRPAPAAAPSAHDSGPGEPGLGAMGLVTTVGEAAETAGAGAVAVAAVLTPVLAGTAAVIFLLVGYLLKMIEPRPAFADTLLTTGWVFGAVTAVAILVATVGLLLTALRNRPSLDAAPTANSPRRSNGPGRPGGTPYWNAASCRSCGRHWPTRTPRRPCPVRRPRRARPTASPRSGTTVPGSAAPTRGRAGATARASRAPTTPARTSEARNTGRSDPALGPAPRAPGSTGSRVLRAGSASRVTVPGSRACPPPGSTSGTRRAAGRRAPGRARC